MNTSGENIIDGCVFLDNIHYGLHLAPAGTSTANNLVMNNLIRTPERQSDFSETGIQAGACIFLPAHGSCRGGYNTLVVPNTHESEASACYQMAGGGSIDMVGDLMLVHPTSPTALFVISDAQKLVTNFGDHDFSEITANTLRFSAAGFNYTLGQWTGAGFSPGWAEVPSNFDAYGETFEDSSIEISEASASARVNATAAFTSHDRRGRVRIPGSYSRGCEEPNTAIFQSDVSSVSRQTVDVEVRR